MDTVIDPDGVATITKTDRSGDVVETLTGEPSDPASLASTKNTYGALGRLASTVAPSGVKTWYDYDTKGRVTETTTGPTDGDPAHTTSTVYDPDLVSEDLALAGGGAGRDWTRDSSSRVRTYEQVVPTTGGGTESYEAELDYRVEFVWDTSRTIPQIIDTRRNGTWFRTDHAQGPITTQAGYYFAYYQHDHQGSPIAGDTLATAPAPESHSPFGQPTGTTPTTPYQAYRAELVTNPTTQNLHLRNRDYDPTIGQFTSPDPLDGVDGTPTVANPYHYTNNNPHNQTDPNGLRPIDDDIKGDCMPSTRSCWLGDLGDLAIFGRVELAGFISSVS